MSSADETLMEVMLNLHEEQRQTADPANDTAPRGRGAKARTR